MRSSEIHKSCMWYTRWESIVSQSLGVHHVPGTSLPVLLKQCWRVTHMTSLVGFTSLWGEADNKQIENKTVFSEGSVSKETQHCDTTENDKVILGRKGWSKASECSKGRHLWAHPEWWDGSNSMNSGGRTFVGEY